MKRLLLVLLCVVFFAGFADFGHAGFLFFGGGGGGGKGHKGRTALDTKSLHNFDFKAFSNVPKPNNDNTNPSNSYNGSNPYVGETILGGGTIFAGGSTHDRGPTHNGGGRNFDSEDRSDRNPAPVPEPATMLLLGAGLIALAGYGRRKFKS